MTVKRITANLAADPSPQMKQFYSAIFDLDIVMDLDWIVTLAADGQAPIQLSIAREGGSGTPVPCLSIEVEDVDATHKRAVEAGAEITYPLTEEPWGVRRFYVTDPAGTLLNVLSHKS